jgi:hypothetical protein
MQCLHQNRFRLHRFEMWTRIIPFLGIDVGFGSDLRDGTNVK